ncbi:hypothetical protein Q5752_005486 [Cryptotrichosporon argae]
MFIYNVHAPSKTFALPYKEGETYAQLAQRLADKSGVAKAEIVYEYDGQRFSLDDDDDLRILADRFPPESSGTTLHVSPSASAGAGAKPAPSLASASVSGSPAPRARKTDTLTASTSLAVPNAVKDAQAQRSRSVSGDRGAQEGHGIAHGNGNGNGDGNGTAGKAKSFMSARTGRSRASKWGDDEAEPLGVTKRREWEEFHANNAVRTIVGEVAGVKNVRMLLKPGHKAIYLSHKFATKHNIIDAKHRPGLGGYVGLVSLGTVPITVAGRTMSHPVMMSEEPHFDVVLGRQWVERALVKVDPLDPTHLTFMDTGDIIPVDLVVLRDEKGDIVTVT